MLNLRRMGFPFLLLSATLFLCLFMVVPGIAEDGGDTGGGQDEPLELISSIPEDGQSGVALDTSEIKLSFSKNVVNMRVKEKNAACFSLYAGEKEIPFEVEMADDQIYREYRRDIILHPMEELQAATTYTVKISPELEAKAGADLGKETSISFTTVGATGDKVQGDNPPEEDSINDNPENTGEKEAGQENAAANADDESGLNTTTISLIVLAAAILLYLFMRRKK